MYNEIDLDRISSLTVEGARTHRLGLYYGLVKPFIDSMSHNIHCATLIYWLNYDVSQVSRLMGGLDDDGLDEINPPAQKKITYTRSSISHSF